MAEEKTKHFNHVHHFYYIKGKKVWEYPDKHLITLCDDCHKFYHEQVLELQKAFAETDISELLGVVLNTSKEGFKVLLEGIIKEESDSIKEFMNR